MGACRDGFEIRRGDSGYPRCVAELPQVPPVLYVRGDATVLDLPSLSIVGSRRCIALRFGYLRTCGGNRRRVGHTRRIGRCARMRPGRWVGYAQCWRQAHRGTGDGGRCRLPLHGESPR